MLTCVAKEYGPQWLRTQWILMLRTANLSTLYCPAATGQSMMAIVCPKEQDPAVSVS